MSEKEKRKIQEQAKLESGIVLEKMPQYKNKNLPAKKKHRDNPKGSKGGDKKFKKKFIKKSK